MAELTKIFGKSYEKLKIKEKIMTNLRKTYEKLTNIEF